MIRLTESYFLAKYKKFPLSLAFCVRFANVSAFFTSMHTHVCYVPHGNCSAFVLLSHILSVNNTFFLFCFFCFVFIKNWILLVAHVTVANLGRLGTLVRCQVSLKSHYLYRLLSFYWITIVTQSLDLLKESFH